MKSTKLLFAQSILQEIAIHIVHMESLSSLVIAITIWYKYSLEFRKQQCKNQEFPSECFAQPFTIIKDTQMGRNKNLHLYTEKKNSCVAIKSITI